MNALPFKFRETLLQALPSGALYWPQETLLVVSDLHLGKAERIARRSGQLLPPYEARETLQRLQQVIDATRPDTVVCLGDSFDDLDAAMALNAELVAWLHSLMAGRRWVWIEGNHDPGPLHFGGTHLAQLTLGGLTFRHIAQPTTTPGEISGHYHPKARLDLHGRKITRPCFLFDQTRLILPAFGTYTGGLYSDTAVLTSLMDADAQAILTGPAPCAIPMPR